MKKIAIVIPVYNENKNVITIHDAILEICKSINYECQIVFVDDGSKDDTVQFIKALQQKSPRFVGFIFLSRNFGHQNALKAGIDLVDADAIITMDGDMQHPPSVIPDLISKWEDGHEIVYTIRKETEDNSWFKRKTSQQFYTLMHKLSSIELEQGTADFRLMDLKVVKAFRQINEYDLFWRGLVKWIGFKQTSIEYEPGKRISGQSKYTFKKMKDLALKGITSFSTKPLTIAIYIGFISSLLSVLYIPYALLSYYSGHVISGWASIIVTIAFFGGLQLMILGIIGIYLGKTFMQSKNRPHYFIRENHL